MRKSLLLSAMTLILTGEVSAADWPNGYVECADEGGVCAVGRSVRSVSFGADNVWMVKAKRGVISCTSRAFGSDPMPGVAKKCAVRPRRLRRLQPVVPSPVPTSVAVPTLEPTAVPTLVATPTPNPTQTPEPTVTAAPTPLATSIPTATSTPTEVPGPTATSVPTSTVTSIPTATAAPTEAPTPTVTSVPTAAATATPTATSAPTEAPSPTVTSTPTAAATLSPTATTAPTAVPTPTAAPTATPTPTPTPSVAPTQPAVACASLDQRVRATAVSVGGSIPRSDEYHPVVIAPKTDSSAVLAWSDTGAASIKLAVLDSTDALTGNLPALNGMEVHAALADTGGTALAIVDNDPDIYSPKYCKSSSTPNNAVCAKLDLVHIDTNGSVQFRTTLTNKKNVDSDGARFIWWYAHSARIATDGNQYGVYYRLAGSSPRPGVAGEIDIHAGDALKFVGLDGTLQGGGWDWGCSHSWSVRLAHNGSAWAAACHGDAFPNAMKIANLATPTSKASNTQWLAGSNPSGRALGDLVPTVDGFWINYIESASGLALKLAKLPTAGGGFASTLDIPVASNLDSAYPFRAYMAPYGDDKLLLGWKSSGKLVLAVADAGTGAIIDGPVTTSLSIDQFQDFTAAPNGDVVWAYSNGNGSLTVNRVASCSLD